MAKQRQYAIRLYERDGSSRLWGPFSTAQQAQGFGAGAYRRDHPVRLGSLTRTPTRILDYNAAPLPVVEEIVVPLDLDPFMLVTVDTALNCVGGRQIVFVDSTSNPVLLTLPLFPASGCRFDVKDYGASGLGNTTVNPVQIDPNGANIDGVGGVLLLGPNDGASIRLVSNGIDWVSGV